MFKFLYLIFLVSGVPLSAFAHSVQTHGYFDVGASYDFSTPRRGNNKIAFLNEKEKREFKRDYTSNPLYDRQISIGYSFITTEIKNEKNTSAVISMHFGDIVEKMYELEPSYWKHFREASLKHQFNDQLKIEAGIMPSLFGAESFINKENMHATRAYMTDFAPDFTAGVRLTQKLQDDWYVKGEISNGWQVLRDNNKDKSFAFFVTQEKQNQRILNYGLFVGDEGTVGKSQMRFYNNIFAKFWHGRWIFLPMLDLGWEKVYGSWRPWQSVGLSVRYALTEKQGLAVRYDHVNDPNQIIPELVTNTAHGWRTHGLTLTYEYLFNPKVTWRMEGRYVRSKDAVFKGRRLNSLQAEDSFLYSSIAFSI